METLETPEDVFKQPRNHWWKRVAVLDRGYLTPCWVVTGGVKKHPDARLSWPEKTGSQIHMHLCEVWGERNLCVRPDHVVAASRSDNQRHWHALRQAAGESFVPERQWQRGKALSEETRMKIGSSRAGKLHSEESKQKMKKITRCRFCDYESTAAWVSRHEGVCHVDHL